MNRATLSIFGLGYVGAVSAACYAHRGHRVIGVDVSEAKVDILASGRSPILEDQLDAMLKAQTGLGRLTATTQGDRAVAESDLSLVCVGTPSGPAGAPDVSAVERVCEQIGRALKIKDAYHVVVIRSTTLPWMAEDLFLPTLERESGKRAGVDFGFAVHPEFLREGTAVKDFFEPPKTVIGAQDQRAARAVADLYDGISAPLLITTPAVAMMVKYTDNTFHALKVSFANEIGRICKKWNIDSQEVMKLVCEDRKLNISPAYLMPAFAFGGSCLPKDVRALVRLGEQSGASLPLLGEILRSNDTHILEVIELVRKLGASVVGMFGVTFKSGTDDLRESAAVRVAQRLARDGCRVMIYDRHVTVDKLIGSNLSYVEQHIPGLARMMAAGVDEVFDKAEVIVVVDARFDWESARSRLRPDQTIVDVQGNGKHAMKDDLRYVGICW